jgi:hypothetical protein
VGSLTLPAATGDEFALGGFAIDSQGRLVAVGTSLLPESETDLGLRAPRGTNGRRLGVPRVDRSDRRGGRPAGQGRCDGRRGRPARRGP